MQSLTLQDLNDQHDILVSDYSKLSRADQKKPLGKRLKYEILKISKQIKELETKLTNE